ncbi:MAG TPA: AMP-binding protein [Noviherbaspirillum sp.]|uniref:AMP-binding protein n=1 Tax=Noviherbaspirillum sp. TaxID=1926288 RepID=UPI002B49FEBF|nr:AMP-binding protein [Noviherbaspirillum sp.]HJV88555.1 AMP-binding protein [Noviherbaspirillum sp.]
MADELQAHDQFLFAATVNERHPTIETPADEQLLAIVQQLARETHPGHAPAAGLHSSFERDLGLDSLARVELMQRVGNAFGVELPGEVLSETDTPRELLRLLAQARPEISAAETVSLAGPRETGLPAEAQTLVDVLEWHVARQPDAVHILLHDEQHQEHPIRYRDLFDGACSIAAGLLEKGVQPGQTVALMLPTGFDYLSCFFGVMLAGAIPVPIYPPARMAQLEDHLRRHARILSNAGAALIVTVKQARQVALMLQAAVPSLAAIVTPAELQATPQALRHRPQPGDIAFLQYTSGSTGDPKGVVLTHANLLANVRALGQATQAGPEDVFVSWLPLYHDMGLIGAWFGTMYHSIPLVLMSPLAFLARPALWLQTITRHRGTMSAAPNFAYELCVRHVSDASIRELDLSSWRLALNGAEPVSPATLEAFAARFAPCGLRRQAITPVYGLAESSVGLAFPPLERGPRIDLIARESFDRKGEALPGSGEDTLAIPSCGRALPGHEIRVVDEAGLELPERHVGRLEFRGPSATSGYYRNPAATATLFHGAWLDSGDYAYMADGEVFIAGRVKDLIKRGGRNLYPYDLEQAAGNIPGIRKGCVAVFASPDPATGSERLVIMAETRERDEAARAHLHDILNQTAVDVIGMPADDIVLVPPHSVPKTSSGKIRRLASKEAYERGKAEQPAVLPWLNTARFMANALLADARVAARRARTWAYGVYAWLLFAVLALPCGGLIMLLGHPAAGRRIGHFGTRLLFRLAGVPLSATGLGDLPRQPHVLLVNHASYLDGIVLSALLPASPGYAFAAKREFTRQAVMRRLLRGLGSIFVERDDPRRGMEDVELIAAALRRGENVIVFPEGTFSREAGLKPFHAGAFVAAARAGAPLVVGGLRGTRIALRGDTWWPRRSSIEFKLGPVLPPPGPAWTDAMHASTDARTAMAALCGEFATG